MKSLIVTVAILVVCSAQQKLNKSYDGYRVLRTEELSVEKAIKLQQFQSRNELEFDFWRPARPNGTADIMVQPQNMDHMKKFLVDNNIHYNVMIEDLQRIVEKSGFPVHIKTAEQMDWNNYHTVESINAWMETLADDHDFIDIVSLGESYESRDMKVLQIKKAGEGKPNVWIEAGIHAREWIAPAMATYLIEQLVNGDGKDFLDHLNIHVLPSANPDGYSYSMTHDRFWRKTRSPQDDGCFGVDSNRNWDFHWGQSGASSNPCSNEFKGPIAFSERENRNIRDYVKSLDPVPILSHCLHSYSQLWLIPYGYDYNALADNYEELKELGEKATDALRKVHGTKFKPMNSADLYPAAGASDDWYKGVLRSRFAYTTELRDKGFYGFALPPDQIKPSGEELWEAFKVMFAKMIELSE